MDNNDGDEILMIKKCGCIMWMVIGKIWLRSKVTAFNFKKFPNETRGTQSVTGEEEPEHWVSSHRLATLFPVVARVRVQTRVLFIATVMTFEPRQTAALVGEFVSPFFPCSGASPAVKTGGGETRVCRQKGLS